MSSSREKHQKALKYTLLIAILLAIPMGYLIYLYSNDHVVSTEGMGRVEDYQYYFDNQQGGITTKDSERFIFLIGLLKDNCEKKNCEKEMMQLNNMKAWAEKALTERVGDIGNPPGIKYILMSSSSLKVDKSWGVITPSKDQDYLVPKNHENSEVPAYVLIDDYGFYRAYLPLSAEDSDDKVKKELTKMISNQFLQY